MWLSAPERFLVTFFKRLAGLLLGLGMLRTWCPLAPSLAVQSPVDNRMVDRTADSGFLDRLHRGHHEHAAHSGLLEKRSQQFLFLLLCEVLAMTTAAGLAPQHGLALAQVVGM
jgi:hypothetical protein